MGEGRHKDKSKRHKKEKLGKPERKKLKEAKKYLKRQRKDAPAEDSDLGSDEEIHKLSRDSYFEKNPEFAFWLREKRAKYFNDLPSAQARELFDEFVEEWNARSLSRKYYSGISASTRRSQHDWNLKGAGLGVEATRLGIAAALEEEQEAKRQAAESNRAEKRQWKLEQRELLEELVPKASGREAKFEAKMARREEAKAREDSPDTSSMPGGGQVYSGGDSFAAAKARQSQQEIWKSKQKAARDEMAQARLREAQAKEDERMAQFRVLAAKGPITIAKRE